MEEEEKRGSSIKRQKEKRKSGVRKWRIRFEKL